MDTSNNTLYEKILYHPLTDIIPYKPLLIWKNANSQLNKKYKELGITDSKEDLPIKNTARHVTGLGLAATQYGNLAYPIGVMKEMFDIGKDMYLHKPIGKLSNEVRQDTKTDFKNNHKGIQYMLNNPDVSSDELMDFAIGIGLEQQLKKEKPLTLYNRIIKK